MEQEERNRKITLIINLIGAAASLFIPLAGIIAGIVSLVYLKQKNSVEDLHLRVFSIVLICAASILWLITVIQTLMRPLEITFG